MVDSGTASDASTLREAWEHQAEAWAAWARTPEHDHFFWDYNLPALLEILAPPAGLTLDVGCGEGRLGRVLAERGHHVVAVDASPTLVRFATDHEDALVGIVADAAALPLPDQSADQVVACMSLQDVDDLDGAVCEIGRVLRPGGVFCMAILHPFSTAGEFADQSENSAFVVERPYPEPRRLIDTIERDGLEMEFHSMHRPLSAYTDALHRADLMIETITEPVPSANAIAKYPRLARELTVPWFLHLRARKPLG